MGWFDTKSAQVQRQGLHQQGHDSAAFADENEDAFRASRADSAEALQALKDQASGRTSVSAEQLRQGLQQNLGTLSAQAASANPNNSAMAARTAMIQGGKLGSGLAGQQAVAGIQERQQAQAQLMDAINRQRALELQAAQQSRANAIAGYGGMKPEKSDWELALGGISGGAGLLAAMSDKRLKTDIEDGDEESNKVLEGLKAYVFEYKNPKHGKGKQLGIMAQDLEKAGLKHAVIETPEGKAVDGAKAATSALALVAALSKRVKELEEDE